jgi:thiamine-monophosphate kinase
MRIGELGEFELIRRISKSLPDPPSDVVVGIGDDVAVLDVSGPEYLLATCDVQVENIHFLRAAITPCQLGRKIIAINVSDIAACGGRPTWALVSLALAPDTGVDFVDGLYSGMQEEIQAAGAAIVGGNLSGIRGEIVIDLSLLGTVAPERLVLRKGARTGDVVLVTGTLGDSRAGLELILHPGLEVERELGDRVRARHLTPRARLREGRTLAATGRIHAMADVSDGVLGDLGHICRASGVQAEIWPESLPISPECGKVAEVAGRDAVRWALTGGEDYELLFTADPAHVSDIRQRLEAETGTSCQAIGRITGVGDTVLIRSRDGKSTDYGQGPGGWDHFRGE